MTTPNPQSSLLQDLLEQKEKEYNQEFGGRIYMVQSENHPIAKHLSLLQLKELYITEHKKFLRESLKEAYEAGEKNSLSQLIQEVEGMKKSYLYFFRPQFCGQVIYVDTESRGDYPSERPLA